jgi:hypothetical protein
MCEYLTEEIYQRKNMVFWDLIPSSTIEMEEAGSSEMLVNKLHGITSQKTTIFIFTAVRTSNLTYIRRL